MIYKKQIRLGMVGGGIDANIGNAHRFAARLDNRYNLLAGALSSTPERSRVSGQVIGLDPERTYDNFTDMAEKESLRKDGIEAVAIVTPNNVHAESAIVFLKKGIHVICDKPLTATLDQAKDLAKVARESKALFILTHNYSGYALIRQAREMIQAGEIGKIITVQTEYTIEWLSHAVEKEGLKQAIWRTDPSISGTGCVGDVGTHAFHLTRFVTGLEVEEISAELATFVPDRKVDDLVMTKLRFKNGAKGMLWASQVAIGGENALRIRVYGTKGSLDWNQEEPNYLVFAKQNEPKRIITRMGSGSTESGIRVSRLPKGHPEGYIEAFANIYTETADAILAYQKGEKPSDEITYPNLDDGLEGIVFVDACVESAKNNCKWISLKKI